MVTQANRVDLTSVRMSPALGAFSVLQESIDTVVIKPYPISHVNGPDMQLSRCRVSAWGHKRRAEHVIHCDLKRSATCAALPPKQLDDVIIQRNSRPTVHAF